MHAAVSSGAAGPRGRQARCGCVANKTHKPGPTTRVESVTRRKTSGSPHCLCVCVCGALNGLLQVKAGAPARTKGKRWERRGGGDMMESGGVSVPPHLPSRA
ncbi:hypothetical protein LIA77_08887 [Sarocladium implicatum]|nr:hypothetical protein LIA77_08887 [Sarocladium implicatum]